MSEENPDVKEPTAEELKVMRDNLSKYYKEQTSILKQQAEFEELQARIAEAKFKTYTFYVRLAQMKMTPKDPDTEDETGDGKSEEIRDNAGPQDLNPDNKSKRQLKKV